MNNPMHVKGDIVVNSKNVIFHRKCDKCKKSYIGWGKYFCSKKCRIQPKGEKSSSWKGEDITKQTGRWRALKMFPLQPCEVCGSRKSERHHIDSNPINNNRENIKFLCRKHHIRLEKRYLHMLKARWGIVP